MKTERIARAALPLVATAPTEAPPPAAGAGRMGRVATARLGPGGVERPTGCRAGHGAVRRHRNGLSSRRFPARRDGRLPPAGSAAGRRRSRRHRRHAAGGSRQGLGAARTSALPPLAIGRGFLIAAAGFALLPEPFVSGPTLGAGREQKNRISPRFGLWAVALLPLRSRRLGLPGWVAPLAIALASGMAARLAVQHGAAEAAHSLIGGGDNLAGAETLALDPDLL